MADRPLLGPRLLDRVIEDAHGPVLLDNLELLLDASLQLQLLNWPRRISRNRTAAKGKDREKLRMVVE